MALRPVRTVGHEQAKAGELRYTEWREKVRRAIPDSVISDKQVQTDSNDNFLCIEIGK